MISIEDRVKSLEEEVAGMKAILLKPVSREDQWESTVGMFEGDPLFVEALRLGREYREGKAGNDICEGA
jgi:hypothetical protein